MSHTVGILHSTLLKSRLDSGCGMRMTEEELNAMLGRNPRLKVRDLCGGKHKKKAALPPLPKPKFDSLAEERYYFGHVLPLMQSGEIIDCTLHKTFEVIEAVHHNGKVYKNREYTPDFMLTLADSRVRVVEIKGRAIKKLQRDYPLRRQLFIIKYCVPNGWLFEEVADDEV